MSEHYYTETPSSEIKEKFFTAAIKEKSLSFLSVSGVFSFDEKIDKASSLLIKHFTPSDRTLLDLGCGFGAIGLFLKAIHPQQSVFMSDINSRAVEYARLNAVKNHLDVQILQSDLFTVWKGKTFDAIVSNPPIAAGKKLNTLLIEQSLQYLNPNGSLWLVAFHNKGGATLKGIMESVFGNVEDVEKSGGIRVYRSIKKVF